MVRPVFTGEVDGILVTTTLWRSPGSEQQKRAEIKEMERQLDGLEQLSIDGATDGDTPATSFMSFEEPAERRKADTHKFLTHAYRTEYNEMVQYGAFGRSKVAIKIEGRRPKTRNNCARVDDKSSHEARVASAAGSFAVAPWDADSENRAFARRSYPDTTSVMRYRTFIPEASVGSPCGRFRGDNRDFSNYLDRSNRSRVSIFFNWGGGRLSMDASTHVGATHKLNDAGAVEAVKTASTAGIKILNPEFSQVGGEGLMTVSINHAIGNPLCTIKGINIAGPIRYSVLVGGWSDRSINVYGSAVFVPNHEIYAYPTSGPYGVTMLQQKHGSFACLSLPACANGSIDVDSPSLR